MKNVNTQKYSPFPLSLLVVGSLALLPACDWFGGTEKKVASHEGNKMAQTANSSADAAVVPADVLVEMDGKPVVTMADLDRDYQQVLQEQPQLASFEPFVKANLLQGLVQQAIVDRYIQEQGINDTAQYKKDKDLMMSLIDRRLNVKYFRDAFPVTVTDAEIKEYFEKNKDIIPDLIVSQGGVNTQGVSFEKEADAKAFLEKAKAGSDLEKTAADAKLKDAYRDFMLVNNQSVGVAPAIKNAVADLKKFPHVQMVKTADDTYWVLRSTGRTETEYRPFDEEVKMGLRQYIEQEKQMKVIEEKMAELKDAYKVVTHDESLKQAMPSESELQEALGMMGNQEQAEADLDLEKSFDDVSVA